MKRAVVWFRSDLRLHDNEALTHAINTADEIIPLYIFDERVFKAKTSFGFNKTEVHRSQFIIESVTDLRSSLLKLGANLIVRIGSPEKIIPELSRSHKANWVYCNRERTKEEVIVQDELEANLWTIGVEMRYCRGKMLYHTADLPFPITQSPDVFTNYRKEVEKLIPIRLPLDAPKEVTMVEGIEVGDLPSIEDFSQDNNGMQPGFPLKGGETNALKELQYYLHETGLVSNYKKTRNEMLGRDYSSKFSAYLATGSLSPKLIYAELLKFAPDLSANEGAYWLYFELLWRDFFRLVGKKYGSKIFLQGGINNKLPDQQSEEMSLFNIWKEGRTGFPLVDANMREMNRTGFMSNRGRQIVASFLIYEMRMNWQLGAEYFESMLVDYDPCSNYGNWQYIAGVGVDPRQGRRFNLVFQAQKHDPEAQYIKHWIPELTDIPYSLLLDPNKYSSEQFFEYGITLGKDYPTPMLSLG